MGAGLGMYIMTRLGTSLVVLNIGIDYFQVLSTFRKSKVTWPEEIKELLKLMQWFNFDIDMTAPECMARAFLTFERKWIIKVTMPMLAVVLAFLFIVLTRCPCLRRNVKRTKNGKIKRRKKKTGKKGDKNVPIKTAMVYVEMIDFYYSLLHSQ